MKKSFVSLALFALVGAAVAADPGGTKLADEVNAASLQFTLSAPARVSFGVVGGTWDEITLQPGKYACEPRLFGLPAAGDSTPRKQCKYTFAGGGTTAPVAPLVFVAGQSGSFTLSAVTPVKYGSSATGAFYQKTLQPGTYTCSDGFFGDPAPGQPKSCYVAPANDPAPQSPNQDGTQPAAPTPSTFVTGQSGTFTLTTATAIKYGSSNITNGFYQKTLVPGTYTCSDGFFGDPAPGQPKSCYLVGTDAASPPQSPNQDGTVVGGGTPTTPTEPTPTPSFDAAAYRAQALKFGTADGVAYKFGSPSSVSVSNTYPDKRASFSLTTLSIQRNEMQADGVRGNRGCNFNGWCGDAQYGTIFGDPGDYSSSIVNVGYIPTLPKPAGWPQTQYFGVAALQSTSVAHNTVAWSPEESWTTYNYDFNAPAGSGGLNNDPNTRNFAAGTTPIGGVPIDGKPVATVGGIGRGGWVNNALTLWANGWITSSGSNTSRNYAKIKLSDDVTPTAGAISNSGEFLFVTVWNRVALKGQVAVIALKDGCQGCLESNESAWEQNWGSARQAYPGMPGLGNYIGGKVLGYVDLPETMKTPTEISVTTGRANDDYQIVRSFWTDNMLNAANRARLYSGDKKTAIANTGMAVVIDKVSQRAAFVDLRPLVSFYREQYVGPQTDAVWNAKIANRGDGDNQFPPTFAGNASQVPVVVKTIELPSKPTAVKLTLHAPHRAVIATEDGTLRVFGLGDNYLNQTAAATGSAGDIAQLFTHNIGANPTNLSHVKEKANLGPNGVSSLWGTAKFDDFMWGVSRGERKLTLLQWNTARTSLSNYKVLQDSRLIDPIAVDDVANHGTESFGVSIADYSGKLVQYLYGPIVMWTYDPATAPCPRPNGCALPNGAAFQHAGSAIFPGKPFTLHGANIN